MPANIKQRGLDNDASENANRHWNAVRQAATAIEEPEISSNQQRIIKHGFYKTTRLVTKNLIKSITHNLFSGQYIILYEDGNVEAFLKDGSKDVIKSKEVIGGLIFASKPKLYITFQSDKIKVFLNLFLRLH